MRRQFEEIYQKHADSSLSKGDILQFTFDALQELKESNQGKSFYAFWRFLMNAALQNQWEGVIVQGEKDEVALLEEAHEIHRSWENSNLVVVPNGDHSLQVRSVYRKVMEFCVSEM